jgi:hypothetical protein
VGKPLNEETIVFFYGGLGLIALAVISFFVYRWMERRGL